MFYTDVLELSTSLVLCPFINNIKNWFPFNIENIYYNKVVKLYIFIKIKFKASRRLSIALTVGIVFGKVF